MVYQDDEAGNDQPEGNEMTTPLVGRLSSVPFSGRSRPTFSTPWPPHAAVGVQGGQLVEQHRGSLLVSAMIHPPPASMTHAGD